jgi:hypothetical protein
MRLKRENSLPLERSVSRAAAISTIDEALDLGSGVTLAGYRLAITEARVALDSYNALLSQLDEAQIRFSSSEEELQVWSRRMLSGVLARYGPDSVEYEKAGGTRDSVRRRPGVGAAKTAVTTAPVGVA